MILKGRGLLFDKVVLGAGLPMECAPGLPLIEIVGHQRVIIENHQGVTAYGQDEICIKVCFGHLCVCGTDLELACMSKHQLVIIGQIHNISIFKG